jgi:predicted CXXCH cytochrome family protein
MMRNIGLVIVFILVALEGLNASILTTKHNLSSSGPGPVKAITEDQICIFCHTPHRAITDTPLWNHTMSSASYQLYTSPTLLSPTSPAIQPDGDSRLCLSCHDGTVAIGSVVNIGGSPTTISMQGTGPGGVMPSGGGYIGTDLSGHHPVSIEVNANLITDKNTQCNDGIISWKVCFPSSPVKLRPTNNQYGSSTPPRQGVQCTSCHDPHNDPNPPNTVFLRIGDRNNNTELCTKCHIDCALTCP